jgi:Asp-tRNA(Asn)/Glu-tRNA(Gln) amidotransferase A subunit family amidase
MATTPDIAGVDELCFTPAVELRAALRRGELSSRELVGALLDRIERVNPVVNAFVTLLAEQAAEQAELADQQAAGRGHGELGALHGLPVTVKDLTPTAGVRTTFGHPAFRDHVPDEDGVIWARLKAAGAILLGKTATPPFGGGSTTGAELLANNDLAWLMYGSGPAPEHSTGRPQPAEVAARQWTRKCLPVRYAGYKVHVT